ncbi:MAG: hypothetical protein NTW48_05485 [Chloroflexi bacterium]|jgi:hypothetical protein|nr:hypothetical protein [Chloroflexota bacterium]
MMEAKLGVTTCDKCQEPMTKGQPVLVIAEGNITESNDPLTFDGSCDNNEEIADVEDLVVRLRINKQDRF